MSRTPCLLLVALLFAPSAFAADRYVRTTGSDVANSCTNVGTPCRTIQHALAVSVGGDTVRVDGGVYDGPLVLDKSVTLLGEGTLVAAAPLAGYTTVRAPGPAPDSSVIVVTAPDVTIRNLNIQVDLALNSNGLLSRDNGGSANADRLHVVANRFESLASGPVLGGRRAMAINFAQPGNAQGMEVRDNFVVADTTGPVTVFRAGIEAGQAELVVVGNDIRAALHDVLSKFCAGDQLLEDNDFRGGGVEIGEYNAPTTSVQVLGNRFSPPAPPSYYAGLRLQNNQPVVAGDYPTTIVRDNTFGTPAGGHPFGVFLQKYPAVEISANTFYAAAPPVPYTAAIVVSNKVLASTGAILANQPLRDVLIAGNVFNAGPGCGGPVTCDGVVLLNHDDDDPPLPDAVVLGGPGALRNDFAAPLANDVLLDAFTGPSNAHPVFGALYFDIPVTNTGPWGADVAAPDNVFAGLPSGPMTVEQLIAVAAKIVDRRDDPSLGLVRLGTPDVEFSLDGPVFLPRDFPPAGLVPCPGVDATGCYELRLANDAGTAVPEYSAVDFAFSRVGGIAPGDVAIDVEETPGGAAVPVALASQGGSLVGRFALPTTAPAEVGAGAAATIRVARVHFPRGGSYEIDTRFLGLATERTYGAPDSDIVEVADIAETLLGPATAEFGAPVPFIHRMNNADGGASEPLVLTIDVTGQDGVVPADLAATYEGNAVTFVPNGDGIRGIVAIAPLAPGELRDDAFDVTFANGEFDSYRFRLALDGTIAPARHYADTAKLVVVGTPNGNGGRVYIVRSVGDSGSTPTAGDNDYTRIDDVVQLLQGDDTLQLQGTFDWSQADAYASWSLGSDRVPGNDDFTIDVPPGLTGLTITAANDQGGGAGGATVLGGGDDPSRTESFESFLMFFDDEDVLGVTSWQGLTISNLHLAGFDFAILADADSLGPAGFDDFDDATYENLTIDVPVDANDVEQPADPFQNVGLFVGWGSGQTVRNNVITLHGNATPGGDSSAIAMQIGDSTNTNAYDGLVVADNTIVVADGGPSRIRGIYENVGDTGSAMELSRNTFTGAGPGDDSVGIVLSSFSSAGAPVGVLDNVVTGAGVGVRVDALVPPGGGNTGVELAGNDLFGNGTALRVVSSYGPVPAAPVLRGNRIADNGVGIDNTQASITVDAVDNWWGCNGGPGAQPVGCTTIANGTSGNVDSAPWLVLRADAAPTPVMVGMSTNLVVDFHRNSVGDDTSGLSFPADVDVAFAAAPDGDFTQSPLATTTSPRGTVTGVYASPTQGAKVLSATADAQTVGDSVLYLDGGAVVITPAPVPSATDNDYTRINDVVQLLASDVTVYLQGTFHWDEPFAAASWALGSDGVAATDDDWTIDVPRGRTGLTFTAANADGGDAGGATIVAGGDDPGRAAALESFLTFYDDEDTTAATTWSGLEISNLHLTGFDIAILALADGLGTNGIDDFDGASYTDLTIDVPVDASDAQQPADALQNIGLFVGWGSGQTVERNTITLHGAAAPGDSSSIGMQIGDSTNTDAYDGLVVRDNDIIVAEGGASRLRGIYENVGDNASAMLIERNTFVGAGTGDDSTGIVVTSFSSAGRPVVLLGNAIENAGIGVRVDALVTPGGGNSGVELTGNTLTANGTGVQVVSSFGPAPPAPLLRANRIVGNGVGVENTQVASVDAAQNWWGCNGGPGATATGCTTPANGTAGDVVAAPWLRLSVAASPGTIVIGDSTPVTATLDDDAAAPPPAVAADFPATSVAFATSLGNVLPPVAATAGPSATTTYQSTAAGAASVTATLDAQTVYTLVRIDPAPGAGGQTFTVVSCTSDPVPCTPDEFDNDYTRIDDLVQVLRDDDTVVLQGWFDWNEPNALLSWSRGSDHVAGTYDDYASVVPAGLTGLTFTAANDGGAGAGGATIAAGGDDPLRDLAFESFLYFVDPFDAPTTWQGLTIENLHLAGFDFTLFLEASQSGNGNDDFDDATIRANTIRVPVDATGAGDAFSNVGLYLGYGSNQVVADNTFYLDSGGTSDSGVTAMQIGDSSNGSVFDGLVVTGNTIAVGGGGPAVVRGIYENAGDTASNIVVAGNEYAGEGSNDVAITITSFGAPGQVLVANNTIGNADVALRVSALVPAQNGESGALLEGNTLVGNGTAVRVLALYTPEPPPPLVRFNRIADNATGIDNQIAADIVAENNWWGCNGGPSAVPAGCTYAPGHDANSGDVDAEPWLVYAIAPQSPIVPPGGFTDVQVDVQTNSALQDVSAGAVAFPVAAVTFDGGAPGQFDAATGALVTGFAVSTLQNITAAASFSSQLDGQTVDGAVQVEQIAIDVALPGAAARGVTTAPFTGTLVNNGANPGETGSLVLTLANTGGPLVPTDFQLELQLPFGPPTWITVPLSDTNGDGQLEAIVPGVPLLPGSFTLNLRATFAVAGDYTLDTLLVGDTSGFFYAQDFDTIAVAGDDEIVVTATGGAPQTAPVNAQFALPLRARVTDGDGRPLSGVTVDFALPTSGASATFAGSGTQAESAVSDASGDVESSAFTANATADTWLATASVAGPTCDGPTCSASYALENTAGSPASVAISVQTTATTQVATPFGAGGDDDLAALVLDADGNPVPGASIAFVSAGSGAGAVFANGTGSISVLANGSGIATVPVSANTIAGTYEVRAIVATSAGQVYDAATLTNTANTDPAQWVVTLASGSPQTAALNQPFAIPLAASVRDQYGNVLAGVTVAFDATPSGDGATATLVPASDDSDALGVAATVATANGTPGSYVVTASAEPACTSATCSVTFALTNTVATPATVAAFDGTPQAATILTTYGEPLVAEVRDLANAPLAGITVTFVAPSSGPRATFDVPGDPSAVVVVTDANGSATTPQLTAGGTAGTFGIVAIVSGPSGPLTANYTLTNLVGAAANLAVVAGTPQQAAINTAYATSLRVLVTDAGGNPVEGVDVAFDAGVNGTTGASAGLVPASIATDANGLAETSATANGFVGAFAVVATADGVATPVAFALENVFDDDDVDLVVTAADATGVVVETPAPTPEGRRSNYALNLSGEATENVFVRIAIARVGGAADGDVTLEYRDPTTGGAFLPFLPQPTLDPLTGELVTQYGPSGGFPLFPTPGVDTEIRATFARGGRYTATASVTGAVSAQVYDSEIVVTDVAELALGIAAPGVAVAGEYAGSSATLRNVGTAALFDAGAAPTDENVRAALTIARAGGLTSPAQVDVQYFDPLAGDWQSLPLSLSGGDLVGFFGPGAGFATPAGYDATTLFRTRFAPTGSYTFDVVVFGVESTVVYASASAAVEVDTGAAAAIAIVAGTPQSQTVAQSFGAPLVVEVRDAGGNVVPGAAISFAAPAAGASATFTSANPTTTDGAGRAQVTVTAGDAAGAYQVIATSTAGAVAFDLENLADADPAQLVVTAAAGTPQTAALNQPFGVPLTVRVADRFGNAVAGSTVAFVPPLAGAGATLVPDTPVVTNASGLASVAATANGTPGAFDVAASATPCTSATCATGFALTNTIATPATVTAFSGAPQATQVFTAFGAPLVAEVRDAANAPLQGVSVTFVAASSGASATFAAPGNPSAIVAITGANGRATSPALTANGTAGAHVVTATASGPGGPLVASFALANTVGPASQVLVAAGSPQQAAINTAYATPLRVFVTDSGGNPVEGVDVEFVAGVNATTGASASPALATVATDANGLAEVPATANGFVGEFTVTATSDGVATPAVFALENVFDADDVQLALAGGATTGVVVRDPIPTPAGQRSTNAFNVSGTATENVIVALSIARAGGAATGDVTLEYRDATTAGAFVPLAAQPTLDPGSGQLLAQYGAPGFTLVVPPGRAYELRATFARGGEYTTTARVVGTTSAQVYDTLVYGTSVAELTLSGVDATVAAAGSYVGSSSTLRNVGTAALQSGGPAPNDENVVVRFTIARVGGLTSASEVDLQFFDTGANDYVGVPLTLAAGTLTGTLGGPGGIPVPAGYDVATLLRTRYAPTGSYTIDVSARGVVSDSVYAARSTNVTVDTGAAASIAFVSGSPQSAVVAQAFGAPLVVEVRDAGGNVVPGAAVAFAAPATGAAATFTSTNPTTTDANGLAQVAVSANTTTGTYDVTATSSAGSVAFTLTNTPGATRTIAATAGTPQSAVVNQPFANALQARVTDQFGNGVPGLAVTFAVPGSGASAALLPSGDVLTDADGFAAKTATANATAGSYSVTATAAGASGTATFALANAAGNVAQLVKVDGDNQTATPGTNVATAPSVRAVDADSNPLAGVVVTFGVGTGGGSATGTSVTTDAAGLATVGSWQLGTLAGATNTLLASATGVTTQTFTATGGTASHDVAITVTNNQASVDSGEDLSYAIVVSNSDGPSLAEDVTLGLVAEGIDIAGADWLCFANGGATCPSASGTGSIAGQVFDLPRGGSVSYAFATTVTDLPGRAISLSVSAAVAPGTDPALGNNSANDADPINGTTPEDVFSDGFETIIINGAGKALGSETGRVLPLDAVRGFRARDIDVVRDARGRTSVRVQALRAGEALYVRLVAVGRQRSPWQPVSPTAALWVTPTGERSARVELVDAERVVATATIDAR